MLSTPNSMPPAWHEKIGTFIYHIITFLNCQMKIHAGLAKLTVKLLQSEKIAIIRHVHKIMQEVIFLYIEPHYGGLTDLLKHSPDAQAVLDGAPNYPNINGIVFFYQSQDGVLLVVQVQGLPQGTDTCSSNVFGFHIHEGNSCSGNVQDPFANTGPHYNPKNCPHPAHAGDLPPLFGCHGYAFQIFFTDRFSVDEVIGRTVIVHASPDDFTSQPSGNSGAKIACGMIVANNR